MRVLVVDDDPSVVKVCRIVLQRSGFDPETAHDGARAWELFNRQPFPVVISDIELPYVNGLELLRMIKTSPAGQGSEVILMTGLATEDLEEEARAGGAFDFIAKPMGIDRLRTTVARAWKCARDASVSDPTAPPAPSSVRPAKHPEMLEESVRAGRLGTGDDRRPVR